MQRVHAFWLAIGIFQVSVNLTHSPGSHVLFWHSLNSLNRSGELGWGMVLINITLSANNGCFAFFLKDFCHWIHSKGGKHVACIWWPIHDKYKNSFIHSYIFDYLWSHLPVLFFFFFTRTHVKGMFNLLMHLILKIFIELLLHERQITIK